jgi:hypothetical protein
MASDRKLREEVAGLRKTISQLRDEIALLRASPPPHSCHGCCGHWHSLGPGWIETATSAMYVGIGPSLSTSGYVQNWGNAAGAAGNSGTYTITS